MLPIFPSKKKKDVKISPLSMFILKKKCSNQYKAIKESLQAALLRFCMGNVYGTKHGGR